MPKRSFKCIDLCFLTPSNSLETLMIRGVHVVLLMDLWPLEQQMIGRVSVYDIEAIGFLDGPYYQVNADIAKCE